MHQALLKSRFLLTLLFSTLCNAYASLGARSVSNLFSESSGDDGVSGSQRTECTTFAPTFPSGYPLFVFPFLVGTLVPPL